VGSRVIREAENVAAFPVSAASFQSSATRKYERSSLSRIELLFRKVVTPPKQNLNAKSPVNTQPLASSCCVFRLWAWSTSTYARLGADFDSTAMWFSRLGLGALLIPEFSMMTLIKHLVIAMLFGKTLLTPSNDSGR
jgi:hypothetical protein